MIDHLPQDALTRHWSALREKLLTGLHPTAGPPIRDEVPVVVFEHSADRGPALLRRLEQARAHAGGAALLVIDYDPAGDGVVAPESGFVLAAPSADVWHRAGEEHGWAFNGASFVFSDDTASWAVMSLTDVLVVACGEDLVAPLFGDRDRAEEVFWAFRAAFDTPLTTPAYRAMTRYARLEG